MAGSAGQPQLDLGENRKIVTALVCGSRSWSDSWAIEAELRELRDLQVVIHGGAGGADTLAGRVAYRLELHVAVVRAQWESWSNDAGRRRNEAMAAMRPDIVLAFWDGKSPGTRMMVNIARKAGLPVKVVGP